ncbi:MAG: hypothetical protein HY372_04110 [Candidatus Andersenbacteria bacterium]|nr:hypothetical protein [Candidatus Andersenbacteria bacterium]
MIRQQFNSWWQRFKNNYHFIQAHAWRLAYGRPERGMAVYGVTGTNGKTTTCCLLDSVLAARYGREHVGMLTTVSFRIGGREEMNETKLTTLPSRLVYRKLHEMASAGVTHAVVEMTSHALDQRRLAGLSIAGAIVLNIEREHLDYHGTMETYARAKAKIVRYLRCCAPLVAKRDGGWVEKIVAESHSTYHKSRTIWFTAEQAHAVSTSLSGEWNKENVLAASLLARAVGIDEEAIARGVAAVRGVPGRMEWVKLETRNSKSEIRNGLARVLLDYAVTPGALERLYRYVRSQTSGKIYAVLGAAGRRDRGKRPAMARAVAEVADELVLTREDPWTEDEEQIFRDLESGLSKGKHVGTWHRIVDRREAITWCLQHAGPNDVVVVTGKGAERGMAVGRKIIPWSEREVVLEILSARKRGAH